MTSRSRPSWSASGSPSRRRRRAAIDVHASKLAIGAAVNVDGPRAWLRVEKAELAVNGGSWLDDFVPELRLSFDATAEASLQDGAALQGWRRRRRAHPGQPAHPDPARLGAHRGRAPKVVLGSVDGEFAFGLEATANLTLELLRCSRCTPTGSGARFTVGARRRRHGQHRRHRQGGLVAGDPQGRRAGDQHPRQDRRRRRAGLRRGRRAPRRGVQAATWSSKFVLSALAIYQRPTANSVEELAGARRAAGAADAAGLLRSRHRPAVRLEPHHRPRCVPRRHRHRRPRRGAVPRRPDRQGVAVPRRAGAAVPDQAGRVGRRPVGAVLRARAGGSRSTSG